MPQPLDELLGPRRQLRVPRPQGRELPGLLLPRRPAVDLLLAVAMECRDGGGRLHAAPAEGRRGRSGGLLVPRASAQDVPEHVGAAHAPDGAVDAFKLSSDALNGSLDLVLAAESLLQAPMHSLDLPLHALQVGVTLGEYEVHDVVKELIEGDLAIPVEVQCVEDLHGCSDAQGLAEAVQVLLVHASDLFAREEAGLVLVEPHKDLLEVPEQR
mmetsp:Transcript_72581/g.200208  ORF Transcript_72581/g.200208 Transcript_72581/m.200208 type:complete len:213 (+) Transcript_72581:871-1509(+)